MSKKRWILFVVTLLMFALVACGQSDNEAPTATEAPTEKVEPTATPTVAPTEAPVEEEPETIPTLEELIAFNSDTQNLSQNYKVDLKLAFGMEFESEGVTEGISMNMVGENLSYENVSCSDISVDMNFMGMEQVTNEKQYTITDIDGMTTEYTYSAEEDVWYKSEYVDFEEDTVVSHDLVLEVVFSVVFCQLFEGFSAVDREFDVGE